MNKTYFLIATTAIALAGCSSNSRFAPMAGVNKSPAETTTPANSGASTEAANNTATTPTDNNAPTGSTGSAPTDNTTTTPPANNAPLPNTTNPSPAPFIPDNPYVNNYASYATVEAKQGEAAKLVGIPTTGTISAPTSENRLGRFTVDGKLIAIDIGDDADNNTHIKKGRYYLHGVASYTGEKQATNDDQPTHVISYVHGIPTPLNSMPTTGTASYAGFAIYDQLSDGSYPMTATADFSAKTFKGHIGQSGQLPVSNQFTATISGNHIQPNKSSKVRLSGSFVGENADGATGRFYDNYNNQGTFGVDKVQPTNP